MYFRLHSDSILVFGYKFCALQNITNGNYKTIPSAMGFLLRELENTAIEELEEKYCIEHYLTKFLSELIEDRYGVNSINRKRIGRASDNLFLSNKNITNALIHINSSSSNTFIPLLLNLGCSSALFVFDSEMSESSIINWIKSINSFNFDTFQIGLSNKININEICLLSKLTHIFNLNSENNIIKKKSSTFIINTTSSFEMQVNTSNSSYSYFSSNLLLYLESQKHNTFFNRKIFITADGEMKNSYQSTTNFGNINMCRNSSEIAEIIASASFQVYWYIHKGLIDICKVCEFRYMCVDNRIPKKRNDKEWFMESECNYNPYIAKWKYEEGYKSLGECGIISNEKGLTINRQKLNIVNKEIWGDD